MSLYSAYKNTVLLLWFMNLTLFVLKSTIIILFILFLSKAQLLIPTHISALYF